MDNMAQDNDTEILRFRQKSSSLAFIHSAHPDDLKTEAAQASIRRHVMRDIGRSRQKRPRHTIIPLDFKQPAITESLVGSEDHDHKLAAAASSKAGTPVYHHIPNTMSSLGILGIDLDDRALEIVHFIKADSEYRQRAFHLIWFRMGLSDASALNVTLATALLVRDRKTDSQVGRPIDNIEAAEYYSKALGQISRRLSNPSDCTSTGVIVTILGFLCHDTQFGQWDRWAVHLKGLDHIVKLRGGISGLENHISLLLFWLELIGRAALDSTPLFPIPNDLVATNIHRERTPIALRMLILSITSNFPRLIHISQALDMLSVVAQTVNQKSKDLNFWQDTVGAVRLIGPVTHYLLSLPRGILVSGEVSQELVVAELLRLVCLTLLSRLKGVFSLNTSDRRPLMTRFLATLQHFRQVQEHDDLFSIKIWMLITFALLQRGEQDELLIPYIRAMVGFKDVPNAYCVMPLVKELIWIDVLVEAGEVIRLTKKIGTAWYFLNELPGN